MRFGAHLYFWAVRFHFAGPHEVHIFEAHIA